MNNRWVLATIVGQAVVTLVAIGYGVSAHTSWETERQRRLDGERAAVAEMAAAMKAAGERLDKVEQELKRCRVQARRLARPPAAIPVPPAASPVGPDGPVTFRTKQAYRLLAGPIAWAPAPRAGPRPVRVRAAAGPAPAAVPALAWCEGRYDLVRGTNFAPCPSRPSSTAEGRRPPRTRMRMRGRERAAVIKCVLNRCQRRRRRRPACPASAS